MARFSSMLRDNVDVTFDLHASAMSLDASGSFAVLAGRRGLHLVDLEAPYVAVKTLHHQTRWDVAAVRCHPHASHQHVAASTSNSNVLLWNLQAGGAAQPLTATLRAHTRAVHCLAWSPFDPTLLATGAADTKTHLWDTRTPQRPVQTLNAFTAGVALVEWHRVDATTLATAHEGEVRVWDTRAGDKNPAVLINAHIQKISAIDWHPRRFDELLTCAEDKTVKFWSVAQPRASLGSIPTATAASCAKYTPFGDGVVTSFSRQEPVVRLWSLSYSAGEELPSINASEVYSFQGHTDSIQSIEWRERASEYQLVSWAKNQELRLWPMERQHLEACGDHHTSDTAAVGGDASESPQDMYQQQRNHTVDSYRAYDVSILKSDVNRVVVAPLAVPLGAAEYSLLQPGEHSVLLTFDDDVSKIGDGPFSEDDTDDDEGDDPSALMRESVGGEGHNQPTTSSEAARDGRVALPCPRLSGGSFSGPNILVVFDSRAALHQARHHLTATPPVAPMAPGKTAKPAPSLAMQPLPRTYEQLLDLRGGGGGGGRRGKAKRLARMVSSGVDWSGSHLDLLDGPDPHRPGRHQDLEHAVHGGSEWASMFFASAELHLPINHPDHRISLPPSSTLLPGLGLSPPRSSAMATGFRTGGGYGGSLTSMAEASTTASLQSDLSLSVALLDLSTLCGVSPLLTYGTKLRLQSGKRASQRLDAGTRDLYQWMLAATRSRRVSDKRQRAVHPLRRTLESLLSTAAAGDDDDDDGTQGDAVHSAAVSDVCAHNAKVASLAGRQDLGHVWSLLELSTATASLPVSPQQHQQQQQKQTKTLASTDALATAQPWRAHPFGQGLVKKVLGMYERLGDVPTLASIVCTLERGHAHAEDPRSTAETAAPLVPPPPQPRSTASSSTVTIASTPVAKPLSSPFSRSRTSFNSLTQLLSGQSDTPPPMRSARRSSSHNEVPRPANSPSLDAKEWPMQRHQQQQSPSTGPAPSGWRGGEVESMFKTWSAGSRAESSPRPLTADTFIAPPPPPPLPLAQRQSSVVDSDEDASLLGRLHLAVLPSRAEKTNNVLLPVDDAQRYDRYKEAYADLLYRYGALGLRSEVLKASQDSGSATEEEEPLEEEVEENTTTGLGFGVLCRSCQAVTDGIYCARCRDFSVQCSVCMLTVRGESMFCLTCGHGGHAHHLRAWFEEEDACPTGCGCWCKQATALAPDGGLPHASGDGSGGGGAAAVERMHSRSYSF